MHVSEIRPLSAGEVLDRAFQVYRRHFVPLFATAFLVFVPAGIAYAAAGYGPGQEPSLQQAMWLLVLFIPMMLVSVLAWAALTWEVHWGASGETVAVGRGYRRALPAAPKLLLLWAGMYVLLVIGFILAAVPGGILFALGAVLEGVVAVGAVVIGGLLVLALWLGVLVVTGAMAGIATAVLVLEESGLIGSLRRAWNLTRGGRFRVAALLAVSWLIAMLPTFGVLMLLGLASTLWDPEAAARLTTTEMYVQQIVMFVIGSATTPFTVAVMVMLYYDRRVRQEGWDVELAYQDLADRSA